MVIKIYKAFCIHTGKVYIGQTKRNLQTRINEHLNYSERKFSKALRKYGLASFEWSILEEHNDIDAANEREILLISKYNSYKEGYNSHIGGRVGGYTTKESLIKRQNTRYKNGGYSSVSKRQKENNVSKRPQVKDKIRLSIKELWKNKEYRENQLKKRQENNPIVKCPYCNKEGRKQIMLRWHYEKCKQK
jgi:group I intron endonuclease